MWCRYKGVDLSARREALVVGMSEKREVERTR